MRARDLVEPGRNPQRNAPASPLTQPAMQRNALAGPLTQKVGAVLLKGIRRTYGHVTDKPSSAKSEGFC